MEGTVTLDVRGTFPVIMDLPRTTEHGYKCFRLRVGPYACDVYRMTDDADEDGVAQWIWTGFIKIEGYEHRAVLTPGDSGWALALYDTPQREPFDISKLEAA